MKVREQTSSLDIYEEIVKEIETPHNVVKLLELSASLPVI